MISGRTRSDRTLVDVAVRDLREEILGGKLRPGASLILADVAERLSMSVMPVREAVGRLQVEGLVEQIPHRGARVSEVSVSDLESLYATRIPLETLAAQLAAERFTEADYESLSGVLEDYVHAYSEGEERRGRESHAAFHLGLYEISRSQWLIRTIAPLWEAAERYQRLSIGLRGSLEKRHGEHSRILECCRERDGEGAAAALEEHLLRSMNLVKTELEELKDGSDNGKV